MSALCKSGRARGYIKDVDLRSAKPKNMTLDEFLSTAREAR